MNKLRKVGQQEMIGFVLIVVLVVVALMVFLVISVRSPTKETSSKEIENFLTSLSRYTTKCAINNEPDYDTIEDLITSCYNTRRCSNLNIMACDYLNQTISEIMQGLMQTESQISAYQLNIYSEVDDSKQEILGLIQGNCTSRILGSTKKISSYNSDISINLKFCYAQV